MKITFYSFFFLILFCSEINGQFILSIKSSELNACKNDSAEFIATVTDGVNVIKDVNFKWSFGDESVVESGLNLDTIKHTFKTGGGFIIRVDASKGALNDYSLFKFEVALTPNFSGTSSDRKLPFCLGQELFLIGKVADSTWKYKIPNLNKEKIPSLIYNLKNYQSIFDYRVFGKNQLLTAATEIDSIGIKLDHSDLSTIKMELICPSGNSITLKDFGGSKKYFGEPLIGGNPSLVGKGYNYYWTNSPGFGTINSATPSGISLPTGSYSPDQPFALLIGCPLNGEWKIKVTDNQVVDSGFVFTTQVSFKKSLLPAVWEYMHQYSSPVWRGNGVSSTSSSGLATAIPELYGNHKYTYSVVDNFGCLQDTSVYNTVEQLSLSADSIKGPFDWTVNFENTTRWQAESLWDFGDKTDTELGQTVTHTYKKDGIYKAFLTATTDDGCKDTASVFIIVTIPISSFEDMPSVFTPNGDGKNDFYKISSSSAAGIETFNCWIYSRWGKKLDEWNSVEEAKVGWDGNFDGGQKATPGVYYFYLKAKGYDGREYEKKGSFQLFR